MSDTPINKIWIEEGCISCKLCEEIAPDVFQVEDDQDCVVRPEAARFFSGQAEDIEQAADDCPVEVIHLEREGEG